MFAPEGPVPPVRPAVTDTRLSRIIRTSTRAGRGGARDGQTPLPPVPDPAQMENNVEEIFVTTASHVAATDYEVSFAPDAFVLIVNRSRDDVFKVGPRALGVPPRQTRGVADPPLHECENAGGGRSL